MPPPGNWMIPPPSMTWASGSGNAPPMRDIREPPLDVEEAQIIKLPVRLALDVNELQQAQERGDVAELVVGQRRLEAGERERRALVDVERQVVGIDQIQRALRAVRVGIERDAADI